MNLEDNPGYKIPEAHLSEPHWRVEVFKQVKDICPGKYEFRKGEMVVDTFKIQRPDASFCEVESTMDIFKIINKDGIVIGVPALTVFHITAAHIKGEIAGSILKERSFYSVLEIVAAHLPEKIPFADNVAAFEIECGETVGLEGVASQEEMMKRGVMTEWDLRRLMRVKENVLYLNAKGNKEQKMYLIDRINAEMDGKVRLGIRSGTIVPFFVAEKQPTSKMFVVIGKEKGRDGVGRNVLWTMAPGRKMERLPTDERFTGRMEVEFLDEVTTVADLWERCQTGRVLLGPAATCMLVDYGIAQSCWWKHGFLVASF